MLELISIILLIILTSLIYKKILNPMNCLYAMFGMMYLMLYIVFPEYKLAFKPNLYIILCLICFFAGTIFNSMKNKNYNCKTLDKDIKYQQKNIKKIKFIIHLFFFLSIVGFLSFIFSILKVFNINEIFDNLALINKYIQDETIKVSLLGNLLTELSVVNVLLIYTLRVKGYTELKKKRYLFILLIEILVNISVRRANLVKVILFIIIPFLYLNGREILGKSFNKKKIMIILLLLIMLLQVFNYIQKELNKTVRINDRIPEILQEPILYVIGNIPSFEIRYERALHMRTNGGYTFSLAYKAFNIETIEDYGIEFENIFDGIQFNTVPMNYYVLRDFGYIGALCYYAILGMLTSYIYRKYRKNCDVRWLWLLTLITYFLIMSIRNYEIMLVNFWFLLICILILMKYFNKLEKVEEEL